MQSSTVFLGAISARTQWQLFESVSHSHHGLFHLLITCSKIFPDATFAHSAISATADWVLGLLPIFFIWDLKMNHRTKISVAVVLSLGIIAGIAAIVSLPLVLFLISEQHDDWIIRRSGYQQSKYLLSHRTFCSRPCKSCVH